MDILTLAHPQKGEKTLAGWEVLMGTKRFEKKTNMHLHFLFMTKNGLFTLYD